VNGVLLHDEIRSLVAQLAPADVIEAEHRREALAWLDSTHDIFRRIAPHTPSKFDRFRAVGADHGSSAKIQATPAHHAKPEADNGNVVHTDRPVRSRR
jgi:hypothetical protein